MSVLSAIWAWLTTNGIGQNVLANGVWALFFGPWIRKEVKAARQHRAASRISMATLHAKLDAK